MKDDDDERFEVLSRKAVPATIDEYMLGFAPDVRAILQKVREAVRNAAPDAEEVISYRMPAFKLNGIIVYFAAFKKHIGLYPPVKGDARLELAVAPYAGPKGNLKFPLDEPIPFDLIERIARFRLKQNLARIGSKGRRAKEQEPAR
jgi:uncharacterized protein YdhG (YjbR/CyaY superfamily)